MVPLDPKLLTQTDIELQQLPQTLQFLQGAVGLGIGLLCGLGECLGQQTLAALVTVAVAVKFLTFSWQLRRQI